MILLLSSGCLWVLNCVYVFLLLFYCVAVAFLLVGMRFACAVALCIRVSIVFVDWVSMVVHMCSMLCLIVSVCVLLFYCVYVDCLLVVMCVLWFC